MAKSKVLHGARAVLWIGSTAVGIFNNVSYGVTYDISPVYILGRTGAAELAYTGMEVIQVTASGFRILENGPFAVVDADSGSSLIPKLQNILNYQDLTVSLHDRLETDPAKGIIMELTNVKPQGFTSSVGARGLQEMTCTFLGLHLADESGSNNEDPTAVDLPAGSE
jgi:hypothetical protein